MHGAYIYGLYLEGIFFDKDSAIPRFLYYISLN